MTPEQRKTPLTAAQRQRRHREKRKAAYAALLEQVKFTSHTAKLTRENDFLRSALEAAKRSKAELAEKLRAVNAQHQPMQERVQALRGVLRVIVANLSPAAARVVRRHLGDTGFSEWLDAD